jgi:hypothetical protein
MSSPHSASSAIVILVAVHFKFTSGRITSNFCARRQKVMNTQELSQELLYTNGKDQDFHWSRENLAFL